MNIAHVGASGNVGSKIVDEALRRGHRVTAIVRHPEQIEPKPGLTVEVGDANSPDALTPLLRGHDAVIDSVPFRIIDPNAFLTAVKASGVKRLMVVGGAASLTLPDGTILLDSPKFPEIYKNEATRGRDFLESLRHEKDLDWTFLSPSMEVKPGERTGRFRLGNDDLLFATDGSSWISQEDYAVAFIDELEKPDHIKRRFTVGLLNRPAIVSSIGGSSVKHPEVMVEETGGAYGVCDAVWAGSLD